MLGKPTVGLLVDVLMPLPTYCEIDFSEVNLVIFAVNGIDWTNHKVSGLKLNNGKWERSRFNMPQVVYNRGYYGKPTVIRLLQKTIGENKLFNSLTRFDKWDIHQILSRSTVAKYLPLTYVGTKENVFSSLREHGRVVVKPRLGHFGKGIYALEMDSNGKFRIHQNTFYSRSAYPDIESFSARLAAAFAWEDVIVQQWLPLPELQNRAFDIRLLTQKNGKGEWQITAAMSRVAYKSFWVTNLASQVLSVEEALRKAKIKWEPVYQHLTEVALAAAHVLEERLGNLGEISVDFGIIPGSSPAEFLPWIVEVNGRPGKEAFAQIEGCAPEVLHNIYKVPIDYALYLVGQGR